MADRPEPIEPASLDLDETPDLRSAAEQALEENVEEFREMLATKLKDLDGEQTVGDLLEDRINRLFHDENFQRMAAAAINERVDDPAGIVPESWEQRGFEFGVGKMMEGIQWALAEATERVTGKSD